MVSKPTTLFVDVGADLSEVIAHIRGSKTDSLTLSFPQRALALQNLINIQVIARFAKLAKKEITIATTDPIAGQLVTASGINLHHPEAHGTIETSIDEAEAADQPVVLKPLSDLGFSAPHHATPLSGFRKKSLDTGNADSGHDTLDSAAPRQQSPSHPFFAGYDFSKIKLPQLEIRPHNPEVIKRVAAISAIGLVLLATVGFFVVPKAYVAIEVQSEAYTKQFTLSLADEQDSQAVGTNILAGRFVESTKEQVVKFAASGEVNKGSGSTGQINVVNYTNGIQGILANTKFATESGLVFKIKSDVLVPPARGNIAGRAVVDADSEGGGAKYNISSPTKLTIPNLSAGLKPLLYGEVVGSFSGGTDNVVKAVSQEDLDHAKEEAAKNIFVSAEADLKKQVKRNEELNPSFIQNDIIDAVPSVTVGAEEDEFEVRVQSRSWTILTPKNSFAASVANAASFEVDPTKQVTEATLAAATIEPVESNFITHRINLLVSLNGRIGPRLDHQQIVNSLLNKSEEQATSYLQGLEGVTTTSLDIWPSFLHKVPLISKNVKLRVIYLGE